MAFNDLAWISSGTEEFESLIKLIWKTNEDAPPEVPVSCAFEPVEDVCASGVVDLVEWVSVGFLNSHSVAERQKRGSNFIKNSEKIHTSN